MTLNTLEQIKEDLEIVIEKEQGLLEPYKETDFFPRDFRMGRLDGYRYALWLVNNLEELSVGELNSDKIATVLSEKLIFVGEPKFKAKPKLGILKEIRVGDKDWVYELMDSDGYVSGYYVDGYIVGKFVETAEDYIHLEYWIPVQIHTLEMIK